MAAYPCRLRLRRAGQLTTPSPSRPCLIHSGWSGPDPECQRISCGFPGYILNGLVNGTNYVSGTTASEGIGCPVKDCARARKTDRSRPAKKSPTHARKASAGRNENDPSISCAEDGSWLGEISATRKNGRMPVAGTDRRRRLGLPVRRRRRSDGRPDRFLHRSGSCVFLQRKILLGRRIAIKFKLALMTSHSDETTYTWIRRANWNANKYSYRLTYQPRAIRRRLLYLLYQGNKRSLGWPSSSTRFYIKLISLNLSVNFDAGAPPLPSAFVREWSLLSIGYLSSNHLQKFTSCTRQKLTSASLQPECVFQSTF